MKPRKYRKGIFFVVYAKTKKGIKYLVLKRKLHWSGWEFPKTAGVLRSARSIGVAVKPINEALGRVSFMTPSTAIGCSLAN